MSGPRSDSPEGFSPVTQDGGVLKKVITEGEEAEYEDDEEVLMLQLPLSQPRILPVSLECRRQYMLCMQPLTVHMLRMHVPDSTRTSNGVSSLHRELSRNRQEV